MKKPAPAAARANSGIESLSLRGLEDDARITSWRDEYATKRAAVSAIDPTIGAGKPCLKVKRNQD